MIRIMTSFYEVILDILCLNQFQIITVTGSNRVHICLLNVCTGSDLSLLPVVHSSFPSPTPFQTDLHSGPLSQPPVYHRCFSTSLRHTCATPPDRAVLMVLQSIPVSASGRPHVFSHFSPFKPRSVNDLLLQRFVFCLTVCFQPCLCLTWSCCVTVKLPAFCPRL